ncbi:MAG: adenosylcobinamide-GDP ribazoletransferase [Anaerolineales bacterium]|nr:adenosylcobinamide-GDP ribazoletransferase [Anaerolineales bacterium]
MAPSRSASCYFSSRRPWATHAPVLALLLAPTWARWLLLFAAHQPAARPGGMGEALTRALTPGIVVRASILPVAALLTIGWWDWRAFAGALLAALAAFTVVLLARRRIGGVTGDVFGAVVEVSEVSMLLAFCLA